ncbi:hypothetical protein [Leptolyngbya sp. FACHB-16]|uniref:hypothetical protein n=1 Tax=unclassified Leptolyngbya TaxID=2650499 RepID=UPI001686C424|nr:hypothetical protein [Leptolyngbya sp. FACHB-16]MBD2157026.1 hypothetical protein [Leptolyngbya sp. FACHB-16]
MTSRTSVIGNLLSAQVSIQGTRLLLWHHFGIDAIPLQKEETEGVAGHNPGEWRRTVLMLPSRQLFIYNTYVFSCIRAAAPFIKRGKSLQLAVSATLQVEEEIIPITDRFVPKKPDLIERGQAVGELPPVFVHIQGVKNPSTGRRNIRYRVAAAPGWTCQFTLQWDKTVVSREEMEALCLSAGQLIGLGDGRTIGFGRFDVKSFVVADTS